LVAATNSAELTARAQRIELVISDNDGVLTDGTVFVSEKGEEFKQFNLRDGMGVELLRNDGVKTAILTRESSLYAKRRAEKLKLPYCWLGVRDKHAHLADILTETGLQMEQIAYIGDDVNDLAIIEAISPFGLTAAPADARPVVTEAVHMVCKQPGGRGAFREFAEWILDLRTAAQVGESR